MGPGCCPPLPRLHKQPNNPVCLSLDMSTSHHALAHFGAVAISRPPPAIVCLSLSLTLTQPSRVSVGRRVFLDRHPALLARLLSTAARCLVCFALPHPHRLRAAICYGRCHEPCPFCCRALRFEQQRARNKPQTGQEILIVLSHGGNALLRACDGPLCRHVCINSC